MTSDVVRITDQNGNPWFIAKDICDALGLGNPSQAISYLDEDERCLITDEALRANGPITVINESGLYSLILRSRKPEAKAFKKWVTSEVLPAIRTLDCSPEFQSRNFAELNREYRGRQFPYFNMTRDGFTFLAMGFNGAKAAEFKADQVLSTSVVEITMQLTPVMPCHQVS